MGVCLNFSADSVVGQSSISEWRGGKRARVKRID